MKSEGDAHLFTSFYSVVQFLRDCQSDAKTNSVRYNVECCPGLGRVIRLEIRRRGRKVSKFLYKSTGFQVRLVIRIPAAHLDFILKHFCVAPPLHEGRKKEGNYYLKLHGFLKGVFTVPVRLTRFLHYFKKE